MAPKLYMFEGSPPVRSARMAAKAVGVNLELVEVNVHSGGNRTPEYLKLNPTHTVPVLDDNGFALWDSHAIITYLVEEYGKDDSLYPKDTRKRAIINQMLHFDSSKLGGRLTAAVRPIILGMSNTIDKDKLDAIEEGYGFLETFLTNSKFLAGDSLTVADIGLTATVSSLNVIHPVDAKTYPRLTEWIKVCKTSSWHSENEKGLEVLNNIIKAKLH